MVAAAALLGARPAAAQEDDLELVAAAADDDLEITAAPPPSDAAPAASHDAAELDRLRSEVAALTARLGALESAPSEVAPVEEPGAGSTVAAPAPAAPGLLDEILGGLHLSAWIQTQYEWSDLSEDEVLQGGVYLNRNRFVLRRGRLRLEGRWQFVELDLELDVSTSRGLFAGVRRATVGLFLPDGDSSRPLVRLRAGVIEIPFGHEVRLGQREMPFMERSTGSLAFFRGPIDVGARLDGALGIFRYDLAVLGGTPLDDRAGAPTVDPTGAPDLVGRLGVDLDPAPELNLAAGVSFLWGTGFHQGTDATQNRLEWRDLNESGTLDTGELIGVPGRAATPSATFEHWALGVDLELTLRTPLGVTALFGEVVLAQNLDRSFFVADPIALGADVRELSAYVAAVQEVLGWALVGVRYDLYDPNSDLLDVRRGIAVPADASIHTLSPLVGVRIPDALLPGVALRLVVQYDAIFDALGRDSRGVPADLRNDQFTVRVQGEVR
jgi:hypothetical protein